MGSGFDEPLSLFRLQSKVHAYHNPPGRVARDLRRHSVVFSPTRDIQIQPREVAVAPRRLDKVAPPAAAQKTPRLNWRAVVHIVDSDAARTSWHMAGCDAPTEPSAHCPAGQHLLELASDPDGHCLVDGQCSRCQAVGQA